MVLTLGSCPGWQGQGRAKEAPQEVKADGELQSRWANQEEGEEHHGTRAGRQPMWLEQEEEGREAGAREARQKGMQMSTCQGTSAHHAATKAIAMTVPIFVSKAHSRIDGRTSSGPVEAKLFSDWRLRRPRFYILSGTFTSYQCGLELISPTLKGCLL